MANVGELSELVNAELVTLTDATNSRDWGQLYNIRWSSRTPVHKRTRLDKKVEQYAALPVITISGDILVTQPEVTTVIAYHRHSSGALPQNNWDLKVTGKDATTDTVRIIAMMTGLDFLGPQEGFASFHIELTSVTEAISEP